MWRLKASPIASKDATNGTAEPAAHSARLEWANEPLWSPLVELDGGGWQSLPTMGQPDVIAVVALR